jgi:sugar-specific transcriptional regulator TrmB
MFKCGLTTTTMRRKLTEILRKANLKEEEIRIYLALLKLGTASVNQIADLTDLKSITIYRAIKILLERKLVQEIIVNKKQSLYKPLTLQALVGELENEEKEIAKLKSAISNLDPFLKFMDLRDEQEEIEIKTGIDNFRAEYLAVPQIAKEEVYAFGSMCNCFKTLGEWDLDTPEERSFIKQRMGKGIHARLLHEHQTGAEEFQKRDSLEKRSTRFGFDLPISSNAVLITEKDVRLFICNEENPRVMIINQPDLKNIYRSVFEYNWG